MNEVCPACNKPFKEGEWLVQIFAFETFTKENWSTRETDIYVQAKAIERHPFAHQTCPREEKV